MSNKIKIGIIIFGVCISVGLVVFYVSRDNNIDPDILLAQKTLRDAVKEAKQGKRENITKLISALGNGEKKIYISEELLSDYISFLKDSDGQVQWLGAAGLYRIKNFKRTPALIEYIESKDIRNLEQQAMSGKLDRIQYIGQTQAFTMAVSALGESGDKSAIPVLESLQGVRDIQLEMGGNPVEDALVKLGAVNSIINIPPDADATKIDRASSNVRKIRDSNEVPNLMKAVQNPNIAKSIRNSSIAAIGDIGQKNPPGTADFLIGIVNDSRNDRSMRIGAAIAAGKTKVPSVEKTLLNYVQDENSDIREYSLVGLVFYNTEKYLSHCFEIVMDINQDNDFRKKVIGVLDLYNEPENNFLKDSREDLYKCLNAADKDGRPIDGIRTRSWKIIHELFSEEPSIILTTRDSNVTSSIRYFIELRIIRKEFGLRPSEEEKKIDEEVQRIVTVYDANSTEEK